MLPRATAEGTGKKWPGVQCGRRNYTSVNTARIARRYSNIESPGRPEEILKLIQKSDKSVLPNDQERPPVMIVLGCVHRPPIESNPNCDPERLVTSPTWTWFFDMQGESSPSLQIWGPLEQPFAITVWKSLFPGKRCKSAVPSVGPRGIDSEQIDYFMQK